MKSSRSTVVVSSRGVRTAVAAAALSSLILGNPGRVGAQESGAFLHLSYVRSQPPPGVNTEPGHYIGAGLTVRGSTPNLYGFLRGRAGLDLGADAPDWGELSALGGAEAFLGNRLALGLAGSGFLLSYSGPSAYRAWAGMLQPSVRAALGRVGLMAQGRGWVGRTSVQDGVGGPFGGGTTTTSDLEMFEGSLDAWLLLGSVSAGIGSDIWSVDAARYVGGRGWISARPAPLVDVGASVFVRDGAGATEAGFVATTSYQLEPHLKVEMTLTRTLTDLLLGSEPTVAAAFAVQIRLGERRRSPALSRAPAGSTTATAKVLDEMASGPGLRRVRFKVDAAAADSVAVVGDFTGWEPRRMRRVDGRQWVVESELEPGVYRYAFVVDGSLYVPEGAPGLVDDGFGQKNLILVVPSE
ncbi:MAG: glycogen-binding domain-containing protein [Gemmatimonadota bacterium]